MNNEHQRIKTAFERFYTGISNTNTKEDLTLDKTTDLLNDFSFICALLYYLVDHNKANMKDLKILDSGCGNGRMLRKLCELGAVRDNCYGVDINQDIIDYAIDNSPRSIHYEVGDIAETKFPDDYFDLVLNLGVLIHILDDNYVAKIARELHRIIKPGGLIFITFTPEGVIWGKDICDITRNFDITNLVKTFGDFQYLGAHNIYSDIYRGYNYLSDILKALENNAINTTYKLIVLKKALTEGAK